MVDIEAPPHPNPLTQCGGGDKLLACGESEDRFFNRELSWLSFNDRVLDEASNMSHPLLERLMFLAISANNLDEFFMVRVAGIKNQIKHGITKLTQDGFTPEEQLEMIRERVDELVEKQEHFWRGIQKGLAKENIKILSCKECSAEEIEWLKEYFVRNISPFLESSVDFPLISNMHRAVIFVLKKDGEISNVTIPIPPHLKRFVRLPSEVDGEDRFLILENIISMFAYKIFHEHEIVESCVIRVIRDTELEVSDEADDLITSFEHALKKRRKRDVVRLRISGKISDKTKDFILGNLNFYNAVHNNDFLGIADIKEIYKLDRPKLKFIPLEARFPERINDFGGDCFSAINAKDIIVHHPYETFDVVVQFLKQAAHDPDVIEIRQTLYRTSSDSPIVETLIEAAKAGKSVTVMVELQARFDEAANIKWGKGLEKAGAKVIYGVPNLKTHTKLSLVIRNVGNRVQSYVHYGTGNYHPLTAKVYSDLSFFTCNPAVCRDVAALFSYINSGTPPNSLEKISVAPFTIREELLDLIKKEKTYAAEGRPANIWIKMNALVDQELIEALYSASEAGVSIDLIIRGVCCLKPNIKGLSENIRVKSIVGRFLEHTRIYCFGGGYRLPSPKNKIYVTSLDWIRQKLDHRVETMLLIDNATVHKQVLDQIMVANMRDQKQTWFLQSDGSYERTHFNKKSFSAHEFFVANPSLSGRGSALRGSVAKPLTKVAVLDIGSNSVRMVVYDGLKRVPLPLFNEKVLCGLAKDMDKTKLLNKDGVKKAYKAIDRFIYVMNGMAVEKIYAFATSAVRDSKDGKKFVKEVEGKHNLKIQTLSGKEEAKFAAMGIISSFHEPDGIVGDLGGGSLEIASLDLDQRNKKSIISNCCSFPIGALRLKNIAHEKRSIAKDVINKYFAEIHIENMMSGKTFYAVGGGFRAIAKIHIERTAYDLNIIHNYRIPAKELRETTKFISSLSAKKIATFPQVSASRVPSLMFTALVLDKIIKSGKPSKVAFSTYGVREGILFKNLDPDIRSENALISGCSDLITHITPDTSFDSGDRWVRYGEELYSWMASLFSDNIDSMARLRRAVCILGQLGWYEHSAYRADVSFRWVLNSELSFLNHEERMFIATALFYRYQTNDKPYVLKKAQALLDHKMMMQAKITGLAMRLGYQISGAATGLLAQTTLLRKKHEITLSFSRSSSVLISDGINKRLKKLANAMNVDSNIIVY